MQRPSSNPILKKIAEKVLDPIIRFFNFPIAYLAGRSERMEKAILWPVIKSYATQSKDWIIQYTKLPKNVEKIPVEWPDDNRFAGYAIILQGPVRSEENFTVETVKYYKRCYPGVTVIVSTWTGSDTAAKAEAEKLGAVWIESEPPEARGAGNVNMQLDSSLAGMKKAKALGCRYAMKTRTDQRIYANDVLQYFRDLQEMFPSGDLEIMPHRLVYISRDASYRYIPFSLGDLVVFGETDEMVKLYSIKRDERSNDFRVVHREDVHRVTDEIRDKLEARCDGSPYELFPDFEEWFYDYMIAESHISFQFFSENICPVRRGDDLMDAYYTYLKKYAVVADVEKVLIYFPKYPLHSRRSYNEFNTEGKMDFKRWLEIYLHYQPKREWKMCGEETLENEQPRNTTGRKNKEESSVA